FKVPRAVKEIREITESLISSKLKFGFEITEQAIIEDLRVLKEFFRDLEIPISIDDFGTGYSSFSQLINLVEKIPIKYLKIDGSYVKLLSTDNRKKAVAVIKSINSMAHAMEIETVAEFVENEEILKHLQYLNVDYGQGYLFGKPEIII
ncbi:MAG: EAL domain-containing protein, partial [Desulfurobacteriaceae bacterium]